jgi:hypothetical protein
LTWEAPADEIDCDCIALKLVGGKSADIFVNWNLWPVFSQHAPAEWFNLAEGDGLHPRPLQAERESADAAEQV